MRLVRTVLLALAALMAGLAVPGRAVARPLTIDDVLDLARFDHVSLSPDREWVAAVVQRAARPGEVYGRTFHAFDPSRTDVWLISRRTGERRNLTQGARDAAGFWCATWSPDGRRLAMLSTQPQGNEPRGGDNVRLYVWDRATGALSRLSSEAVMTQTRSPIYPVDVRGGANGGTIAHRCHAYENAPFAWLDERRLLAIMLPPGGVSALIDEYRRPLLLAGQTADTLRAGVEPTMTAVGSGAERVPSDERSDRAVLQVIDVEARAARTIATVPTYPFRGELTVNVDPQGRRIAVLATLGTIPPNRAYRLPHHIDTWVAEKRLAFVDVALGTQLQWVAMPAEARYPLELLTWAPDGSKVALRARAGEAEKTAQLFVASPDDLSVERIGPAAMAVGGSAAGSKYPHEPSVFWIDNRRLLARASAVPESTPTPRADWWLFESGTEPINVTAGGVEPPAALRRSSDERFFAIIGDRLMRLDIAGRKFEPVAGGPLPPGGSIIWPQDQGRRTSHIMVAAAAPKGRQLLQLVPLENGGARARRFTLPRRAEVLDVDPARGFAVSAVPTLDGLFLRETSLARGDSRDLLALDRHLAAVDWGQIRPIDYRTKDGKSLKAAAILPPGYRPGRRYPTLVWVYGGYRVRDLENDYFLDPHMEGFYNLHLYAARGYVVLIPSMPLTRDKLKNDSLPELAKGVLPAVDRLVEIGIADPQRVGVFGQSFGGYTVYALVTQTTRFKAAVGMAGFSDVIANYTQFDATARGYPGIEHEKSDNWSISEPGQWGFGVPPYEDYPLYWRNSPLAFVSRVGTPLLLIHGEQDTRGSMTQAESFFFSLYRQGKTARLLRYWGENHGLSSSPANVRSVFEETLGWFNKYLVEAPAEEASAGTQP